MLRRLHAPRNLEETGKQRRKSQSSAMALEDQAAMDEVIEEDEAQRFEPLKGSQWAFMTLIKGGRIEYACLFDDLSQTLLPRVSGVPISSWMTSKDFLKEVVLAKKSARTRRRCRHLKRWRGFPLLLFAKRRYCEAGILVNRVQLQRMLDEDPKLVEICSTSKAVDVVRRFRVDQSGDDPFEVVARLQAAVAEKLSEIEGAWLLRAFRRAEWGDVG